MPAISVTSLTKTFRTKRKAAGLDAIQAEIQG